MKDKSQLDHLRRIKEGSSVREKRYEAFIQQRGGGPITGSKNLIALSSVPSSAREKYNGGKDD